MQTFSQFKVNPAAYHSHLVVSHPLGIFKGDFQNPSSFKSMAEAIAVKVTASPGPAAVTGGPDGLSLLLITSEKVGWISA